MDTEFDIPPADELEWLESRTHYPEDDDDLEILPYEKQNDGVSQSESNPQKRLRSNTPESLIDLTLPEEKRSKVNDVENTEEDWLKYSPLPQEERVEEVVTEKIISRYVSEIDGEFVPATAPSSGDRVYAKFCRTERNKKLDVRFQSKGLISESVDVLLQRLDQEAFTKALQATSESQSDVEVMETREVHEQLWVDKYAPSSFTELLSDEHTNREVLLWLKQWDSSVFGSDIRSTSEEVLSALRLHSSLAQRKPSDFTFFRKNRGKWAPGNFRNFNGVNNKNSNSRGIQETWSKKLRHIGPPEQKILLLCGHPGLGKTTLAHVAAKHCGYRVVEINASDDRSSSTIEAKILDVVQMDSVMADSRPKCLVIDEIDGALGDGRGAVEVILKMVAAEKKVDAATENINKGDQSKRPSSKKGHKAARLLRPVICICNDLYAPALRPLRQVAKVHVFVQPTITRVVSRLKHICNKEGMKTSSIALTALAEYTECDIRSCLNTLQFLNNKKETLDVTDIGAQVIGRKDISKGVFDIWKEIFQKRKSKQERKSYGSCKNTPNEMEFLHSLLSNRGDYDVIFDGIHENILQLQFHDPLMQKTVKCFNSLGISDVMQQYIMRTQQMPIYAYQSPIAITVHRLVAQVQKPNIEWPKSYQRFRTTLLEKTDTLRSWQTKMPPFISRHLSTKSFVEDTISSLLHILSPANLRPVALHLLTEKEKNDFSQLVSTMVSYVITYKNVKAPPPSSKQEQEVTSDTLSLSFDPPIYDFVRFKGYNPGHYVLPLPMKQVLVHEVEKQKILQVSKSVYLIDGCHKENPQPTREKNRETPSAKINRVPTFASGSDNGQKTINPIHPNGSKTSKPLDSSASGGTIVTLKSQGNVKKPSFGSFNFFDRFRKANSKDLQNEGSGLQKEASERDSRPLLFKFNEGFTNAIKKPVRMREFL